MGLRVVVLWDWELSIYGIRSCLSMGLRVVYGIGSCLSMGLGVVYGIGSCLSMGLGVVYPWDWEYWNNV